MNNVDLYNKSKMEVYVNYLNFLDMFSKCDIFELNDNELNKINTNYKNYLTSIDMDFKELVDYQYRKLNGRLDKFKILFDNRFDELVNVHFINEYIRNYYTLLKDINPNMDVLSEYNNFIYQGLNKFMKRINHFTFYDDNNMLDYYAESLKMHYKNDTSNLYNIFNKINECIGLALMFYKCDLISDLDNYKSLLSTYNKILNNESLVITNENVSEIFDKFSIIINDVYLSKNMKKVKSKKSGK